MVRDASLLAYYYSCKLALKTKHTWSFAYKPERKKRGSGNPRKNFLVSYTAIKERRNRSKWSPSPIHTQNLGHFSALGNAKIDICPQVNVVCVFNQKELFLHRKKIS